MMLDPFSLNGGFTLTQLSQAINVLPNMYSRYGDSGLFPFKAQSTNTVTIEMKDGVLALVQTTPWGGPAPKNKSGKRNIRSFNIPHMPFEDTVKASDVIGIRQFGSESNLETVATRVNDKMQEMKNKIDQTLEWRKMGALKGIVLDADGTTVIENYFTSFGVTQKVIDFQLDVTTTDVPAKVTELLRWMEDNLMGERMSTIQVDVSPEFYDAFTGHASVESIYSGWSEAQNRIGGDLRKGFTLRGVTFSEYRATVDGHRFIDAGDGYAYPLGTVETFANFGAPADFVETVNTLALPYYARQQNTDFNRGIDLHVQANQLPMLLRPALSVRVTI